MTTRRPLAVALLCAAALNGCQRSSPDAVEQARMSRAMAKMEANQALTDRASVAAYAKAATLRRDALASEQSNRTLD